MDFNNVYINDDIIDIIFKYLDYNDMILFSHINSFLMKKYKKTIKYKIFDFLNNDYKLFNRCIQRYSYNEREITTLFTNGIDGINIIWGTTMTGSYDLRYLFELIYKGVDIRSVDLSGSVKEETLKMMVQAMKRSKSFSRSETKKNINEEPILRSLHNSFKPDLTKTTRERWIYI